MKQLLKSINSKMSFANGKLNYPDVVTSLNSILKEEIECYEKDFLEDLSKILLTFLLIEY